MKNITIELNEDEINAVSSALSIFAPTILVEEGATAEYNLVTELREKLSSLQGL